MLKNNRLLDDFKQDLIARYDYEDDFAETIVGCVESIIDYYKDKGLDYEDEICDAVLSCKYVIAPKSHLDKNGKRISSILSLNEVMKNEGIEPLESLNNQKSAYVSMPSISYHDGIYELDGVRRVIGLSSTFNPKNHASIGMLIHETLKLINSCVNEYTINGNSLLKRSGLEETVYRLSFSNGEVQMKKENSFGYGISEGLNYYDERAIVRDSIYDDYETYGPDDAIVVAGALEEHSDLKKYIKEAQIKGDSEAFQTIIRDNSVLSYTEFLMYIDKLYYLEMERSKSVYDDDQHKRAQQRLDDYFKNVLAPELASFSLSLKRYERPETKNI